MEFCAEQTLANFLNERNKVLGFDWVKKDTESGKPSGVFDR